MTLTAALAYAYGPCSGCGEPVPLNKHGRPRKWCSRRCQRQGVKIVTLRGPCACGCGRTARLESKYAKDSCRGRAWAASNPDERGASKRRWLAERRAWLTAYKLERGCVDCGTRTGRLEFDHCPGTDKRFELSHPCRSWDLIHAGSRSATSGAPPATPRGTTARGGGRDRRCPHLRLSRQACPPRRPTYQAAIDPARTDQRQQLP